MVSFLTALQCSLILSLLLTYQIHAGSLFTDDTQDLKEHEFDDVLRQLVFGYSDHEQYRRASLRYQPHVLYKKASLKPIIGKNGKTIFNKRDQN